MAENTQGKDKVEGFRLEGGQVQIALDELDLAHDHSRSAHRIARFGQHVFGDVHCDQFGDILETMEIAAGAATGVQNGQRSFQRAADLQENRLKTLMVFRRDLQFVVRSVSGGDALVLSPEALFKNDRIVVHCGVIS